MANGLWVGCVQDGFGRVVSTGALIEVRDAADDLVTIYKDKEGLETKGNPFLTTESGIIKFYCEAGRINITASKNGEEFTFENEIVLDDWNPGTCVCGVVDAAVAAINTHNGTEAIYISPSIGDGSYSIVFGITFDNRPDDYTISIDNVEVIFIDSIYCPPDFGIEVSGYYFVMAVIKRPPSGGYATFEYMSPSEDPPENVYTLSMDNVQQFVVDDLAGSIECVYETSLLDVNGGSWSSGVLAAACDKSFAAFALYSKYSGMGGVTANGFDFVSGSSGSSTTPSIGWTNNYKTQTDQEISVSVGSGYISGGMLVCRTSSVAPPPEPVGMRFLIANEGSGPGVVSWNIPDFSNYDFPPSTSGVGYYSIAASTDGARIVAGYGSEPYWKLFNQTLADITPDVTLAERCFSIAITQDGNFIAAAHHEASPYITVIDLSDESTSQPASVPAVRPNEHGAVAWNHDGSMLALAGSTAPSILVYSMPGFTPESPGPAIVGGPYNPYNGVVFSGDGALLACATSFGPGLVVYDTSDWSVAGTSLPENGCQCVAYSEILGLYALGDGDGYVYLIDATDYSLLDTDGTHGGDGDGVTSVSFSSDGAYLLATHNNGANSVVYDMPAFTLSSFDSSNNVSLDYAYAGVFTNGLGVFNYRVGIENYAGSSFGYLGNFPPYTPYGDISPDDGVIRAVSVSNGDSVADSVEFVLVGTHAQSKVTSLIIEGVGSFEGASSYYYATGAFAGAHTIWTWNTGSPGWDAIIGAWPDGETRGVFLELAP